MLLKAEALVCGPAEMFCCLPIGKAFSPVYHQAKRTDPVWNGLELAPILPESTRPTARTQTLSESGVATPLPN